MPTLSVSTRHSAVSRSFHHIRSLLSAQWGQDVATAWLLQSLSTLGGLKSLYCILCKRVGSCKPVALFTDIWTSKFIKIGEDTVMITCKFPQACEFNVHKVSASLEKSLSIQLTLLKKKQIFEFTLITATYLFAQKCVLADFYVCRFWDW